MSGTEASLRCDNSDWLSFDASDIRLEEGFVFLMTADRSLNEVDFSRDEFEKLLIDEVCEDDEGIVGLLFIPNAFERLHLGFVGVFEALCCLSFALELDMATGLGKPDVEARMGELVVAGLRDELDASLRGLGPAGFSIDEERLM